MKESYLQGLDEFVCATYSDYVKISSLEGYRMPEMVAVGRDGNFSRLPTERMRICYQSDPAGLLETLKAGLTDVEYSFSFAVIPVFERVRNLFRRRTFRKLLPVVLSHAGETTESAGEKLAVAPKFWKKIVKGKLYPEKNTLLALALVCRLTAEDTNALLDVRGFTLRQDSLRDVVISYLIEQKLFNEEMRDRCLSEYKIENLPIARQNA
ncbi:MAG: hypothetical protein ACI4NG_03700 [Candidatus Gallimonas sp.]